MTTSIFVMTAVNFDLTAEQRPDENASDILWSGQVFRSLETAKASVQREVDDCVDEDEWEGAVPAPEWSEFHRVETPDPEEGEAEYVGYIDCQVEELTKAFVIREFRI